MLKNNANNGAIILILAGIGVALFIVAIILRPAGQVDTPSSPVDFTKFDPNEIATNETLFELRPLQSEARFILDELLRGNPKTVIGRTDEVGGQLVVDFANLPSAQFSDFAILAETLKTDNSFRDSAVRDRVLFTNEFPLISFVPESLTNLPESIVIGDTAEFEIEGTLTIKNISQPEIFLVVATAVSATEIDLFATTQIQRTAYDLVIPAVQNVANVDETILLELDLLFTAVE